MSQDDPKVTVSSPGGATETDRRLFSVIFISDLGAHGLASLTSVDKDSFADVLRQADVRIPMAVRNPLGGSDEWEFELNLASFKSFEPAGLLAGVPGAGWRLGLREKLIERRGGNLSADKLQAAIEAAITADPSLAWLKNADKPTSSTGGATSAAPAGGSVLDLVDEPDPSKRVEAEVTRMAANVENPSATLSGGEIAALGASLNRLNLELSAIVDAVLKHPAVRKLETAWRSLKLLIDRVDFREGIRVGVVSAPREEAVDSFINQVVNPAFDGDIPTPGLVVFDYPVANNPADIAMLDTLAQHAASLPTPVAFPLAPQFFDVKSLRLLKNLPNLVGLLDGFQFAKWKGLRDQRYSRSLAPVLGSFLLRSPHTARSNSSEFTCDEKAGAISDLLWGSGAVALAVCAARAFSKHGWPTRMFGGESGKLEDLPVVPNPNDPQSPWGPGDLALLDRRMDELPAVGVNALISMPGKDFCMLTGGVTAARPQVSQEVSKQDAVLETSLPYQQFSSIASAFLCDLAPKLRGLSEDEVQQKVLFGLVSLLRISRAEDMEAVQVGVAANPQNPSQTLVQVRITPPAAIVPGGLHVEFGFAV